MEQTHTLTVEAVRQFETALTGRLIRPTDADYDELRAIWNGMIDRRPALIAQCADAADVVAAVNFARENDLPLSVRAGGHNVAGSAVIDDGLVIDLRSMKRIEVNPATRHVRVEGGVTIGELDRATQPFGLAVPMGVVSATGIAGLTLGGGLGWLRNKYGLSSDNLIAAEVVTADGRLIRASGDENPDLLWALRGGGGNFGIVTTFELQAYSVGPEVMFAGVFYPAAKAAEALRFYRDFVASAPDEVSSFSILGKIPAEESVFPVELHHEPYVLFLACYSGDPADGARVLQPLREFDTPMLDISGVMPYVEAQTFFDADYPSGARYYWKSIYIDDLSEGSVAQLVAQAARMMPDSHSTIDIWHIGGAVARVGESETAFSNRHSPFLIGVEANWHEPADDVANIGWARATIAAMLPFSDGSEYVNFPGFLEERDQVVRDAYRANLERLSQIKAKYDPTNLFNQNQNIKPALA
jgi:FAD/FMN-containing dehydrogenase